MNLLTKTAAYAVVALMLAAPALRAETEIDAATQDKVRAELTAQGYDVRKIDSEDGMIEVYAVKDGKTYELYLDADLKVVKSSVN